MTRYDLGWGLGCVAGLLMAVLLAPVWVPCAVIGRAREARRRAIRSGRGAGRHEGEAGTPSGEVS